MLAKCHGLHDDLKAARRDVCYIHICCMAGNFSVLRHHTCLSFTVRAIDILCYCIINPAVPVAFTMASVC